VLFRKFYLAEAKELIEPRRFRCWKKGEIRNEGGTHDVTENKGKRK
jgi:hypothetical protein